MHMVSGAVLERWTGLSDPQVVELVLSGQTALFEILMRRHNERLFRAARAIVLDEREAEDVVQQAWVNAYAHLRQFDGRAQLSTWLTRIAVNEAIARARRQGRYRSLDAEGPTRSPPSPRARRRPIPSARRSRASWRGCSNRPWMPFPTGAAKCSSSGRCRA